MMSKGRAVGEGEDVGGQGKTGEEGEEEFHGLLVGGYLARLRRRSLRTLTAVM